MISIYNTEAESPLNIRRKESIDKYLKLIQWGRANPTRFIEEVLGIQLMDFQKNIILGTWTADRACWCASRNSGKSFLGSLYMMTRAMLMPDCHIFIMSNSANQAQQTFQKLENIAKGKEAAILNSSGIFFGEIIKNNANQDGFTHYQGNYSLELYNGSTIETLVAKADNVRGRRSNVNFYDEAAFIEKDYFDATTPFVNQNIDFKTGKGFNPKVYPKSLQNQIIMSSSAGSVDSVFYETYKQCAKNMIMGIPGYYAVDIDCELTLKPYCNGIEKQPLANKSEIDMVMQTNPDKGAREYYNVFSTSGGADSVVQRPVILRNEKLYLPESMSTSDDKHYIICMDPALQADNSFVLIGELFEDKDVGWKARVINGINLIEKLGPTDKRPLRVPEQVDWIRKIWKAYNGNNTQWTNIDMYIDAGAGGNGRAIADFLMVPWEDENGMRMVGGWDSSSVNEAYIDLHNKYPQAFDFLHLMDPQKYKVQIYTDVANMMQQDLIELPPALPPNGEITMEDGEIKKLTLEETRALVEMDLMKEEIMAIEKTRTNAGNVSYNLPPSKEKKMHDDRASAA